MTAALLERERSTVRTRTASNRSAATRSSTQGRASSSRTASPRTASPRTQRPKLKVLDQGAIRQRARRRQALLSLFIVVLLGFFAVAFVHAELVADQQELDGIRARIAEAEAHNAKVARAAEEASSPRAIVTRATELGMVRAHEPVYLAAAAPVRDIPDTISFSGRQDQAPTIVAPATAADLAVDGGISGTAVVSTDPVIAAPAADGAALATESASTDGAVAQTVPTPADDVSSSISGSAVSVSAQPRTQTPVVVQQPVQSAAAVAGTSIGTTPSDGGAAAQTQTSIAGTRAVSAGQQEQGQQQGQQVQGQVTNRFGGTNAGTGSG